MRIRLETTGCRLNISEIEKMGRVFAQAGHRLVQAGEPAELCVLNTCAVTSGAGKHSRQLIRQLRKNHPTAKLVVTGCYSELEPDTVQALGVDLLVPNSDKDQLPDLLAAKGWLQTGDPVPEPAESQLALAVNHTRAFVKVQDGCKNKCTFCIVTVARGNSRSRSLQSIVTEVQQLQQQGYQEVVLSGVHLGSYGQELSERGTLFELVRSVLSETDIARVRLSSLEPWDISPEFFSLWQNPRLLPHLHLPLQSGCDATLRRMARKTNQASFRALVAQARQAIPELALTTDVMVGFPGEDAGEFAESFAFVAEIKFAKLHIFRFSARAGTAAATMPKQVPPQLAQQHSEQMHQLGATLEHDFQEHYLGQMVPVLWENGEDFGLYKRWTGLTSNYLRVLTDTLPTVSLHNQILPTTLVYRLPGGLFGNTQFSPFQLKP
jgi:threonylcarbamoyladenosine tRNA methylthiotransferase MtaB